MKTSLLEELQELKKELEAKPFLTTAQKYLLLMYKRKIQRLQNSINFKDN